MPYYITDSAEGCGAWATIKDDGEVMGCHLTKDEAIDQMVALSIEEGIEPGGERSEVRQVDTDPPAYIAQAAARGLELRADGYGGDGLTDQTIREARRMADGEMSADKVVRANAWAARHAGDLDAAQNSDADADGWPGAGAVAHYLWGIDPLDPGPARAWLERKAAEIQADEEDGRMAAATRDDVQVRQLDFEVARDEDGLTLDGYGAVFDSWTEIADAQGLYRERIAPGAFRRTLGQRMPVLQFDHGQHPLIGSIPLGRITSINEDAHGLRVRAKLSDNWLVEPVRDAIRDGAVTGMSFRFRVMDDEWARGADGMDERTIREVALLEVGPVVFPAYSETSVSVRSIVAALVDDETRHEVARALLVNDPESFATIETHDDSAIGHSSEDEPSTVGHGSMKTRAQRRAKAMLAGVI